MTREGKIIATCGHEIPSPDDDFFVSVARLDREGRHVVSLEVACHACKNAIRENHSLLDSPLMEQAWLNDHYTIRPW